MKRTDIHSDQANRSTTGKPTRIVTKMSSFSVYTRLFMNICFMTSSLMLFYNLGICKECGCSFEKHMRINCEYQTFTTYIELNNRSEQQSGSSILASVSSLQSRIDQLKKEEKVMIETSARFASFLGTNAIAPSNDAFIDYLNHFIEEEKRKQSRQRNSGNMVEELIILSEQYKREKARYDEYQLTTATKQREAIHTTSSGTDATPELIFELIKRLYALPINGSFIRQQVEYLKNARTKNVGLLDKTVSLPIGSHPQSSVMHSLCDVFANSEPDYF